MIALVSRLLSSRLRRVTVQPDPPPPHYGVAMIHEVWLVVPLDRATVRPTVPSFKRALALAARLNLLYADDDAN